MAWTGIENFDSYTPGTTISSAMQGGSGWDTETPGWQDLGGGDWTVENAPSGGQGGVAARCIATTGGTEVSRNLPNSTSAGTCWCRMRISVTDNNDACGVKFHQYGAANMIYVLFRATDIQCVVGSGYTYTSLLTDYAVDTWYTIKVEWDDTNHADQFQVTIDNGTPSGWLAVAGGSYDEITGITLASDKTNAGTFWVDDIRDTEPSVETATHDPMWFDVR